MMDVRIDSAYFINSITSEAYTNINCFFRQFLFNIYYSFLFAIVCLHILKYAKPLNIDKKKYRVTHYNIICTLKY